MESLIVERKSSGMEFSYRIVWESSFQTLADEIRRINGFRAKKDLRGIRQQRSAAVRRRGRESSRAAWTYG